MSVAPSARATHDRSSGSEQPLEKLPRRTEIAPRTRGGVGWRALRAGPRPGLKRQREDVVSKTQPGAEVILELLRTNGIDCVFASPIAVMAPLWEALAARRERGDNEVPRYIQCR